jgi:hypothetical protein
MSLIRALILKHCINYYCTTARKLFKYQICMRSLHQIMQHASWGDRPRIPRSLGINPLNCRSSLVSLLEAV